VASYKLAISLVIQSCPSYAQGYEGKLRTTGIWEYPNASGLSFEPFGNIQMGFIKISRHLGISKWVVLFNQNASVVCSYK
jgi:hypothetical protein